MNFLFLPGRRNCKKMAEKGSKVPLFSFILLVALILLVYADTVIYCLSLRSVWFGNGEIVSVFAKTEVFVKSTVIPLHLRSMKEELEEGNGENGDFLVPPTNISVEERRIWFKENLPALKIFQSNELTREFHRRILEFLGRDCEVQFFMTWISPASLFGAREFLALESLFKAHPTGCLTILSRTMDSKTGYSILKPILDRSYKILAVSPDLTFLFHDTPAEIWFEEMKCGSKDPGEIPLAQNLSNLIRLAILYKYGGIYLDFDFIILKPLTGLKNAIAAQSVEGVSGNWTRLNNAVLIFDLHHPLVLKFMEEFTATFDGNKWGHNGPYLVSRVIERVGASSGYYNFTILPPMAFYPVDWRRVGGYFKTPKSEAASRWAKAKLLQLSGNTYGVHLWNKQSRGLAIEEGSVMHRLISDRCLICTDQTHRL